MCAGCFQGPTLCEMCVSVCVRETETGRQCRCGLPEHSTPPAPALSPSLLEPLEPCLCEANLLTAPKVGSLEEGSLPVPSKNVLLQDRKCAPVSSYSPPAPISGFFGDIRMGPSSPALFPSCRGSQDTLAGQVFPEFPQPWGHKHEGGAMAGGVLWPP